MIEHNGKMYARVTEVLEPFNDFTEIDKLYPGRKEAKGIIGTNVHTAIDEHIGGGFPILSEAEEGYFKSYLRWCEYVKPFYVETEQRYFDEELMITGQIDGIVRMEGSDDLLVVDYKTSAFASQEPWSMQGHMYHYMASKKHKICDRIIFLKLDKKSGIPTAYTYKFNENEMKKCKIAIEEFWKSKTK